MRWIMKSWIIVTGAALLAVAGPARAAGSAAALPSIDSGDFARTAATVAVGARLRLENAQMTDTGETAALVLERFEVFASDAKIVVHGEGGDQVLPAPKHAYFRGTLDGRPGSRAFLARLEDGSTQGMVSVDGAVYLVGADPEEAKALGGPLQLHRVDPVLLRSSQGEGFACSEDKLAKTSGSATIRDFTGAGIGTGLGGSAAAVGTPVTQAAAHTARVAVESDHEFYALFNSAATATTYIGNLLGYSSTIYTAELNTSLVVQSVSLWSTAADPWTQNDTLCGLMEFGKYWNQNHTAVSRTIAHFFSGKPSGGGVAWLNALCDSPFNSGAALSCPALGSETTPWGGGYGFTGNLSGNFNVNAPSVVWDILAVTHEIGHNFGSPHSHCYANIGGNPNPIDQCYSQESGCYSGTTSLPGPPGAGSGTIMSYCHLTRGSYSDVSLSFGTGFAFGVVPGRESAQMNGYVSSVVSGNASCLAPVIAGLFSDGFEGGLLPGPWSGKTP
jgi:hypothetical protein